MHELLVSKISPNRFYRRSRGSKNRGSRKRNKNNYQIELGKTVTESPKIKDSIALNNFNVKNTKVDRVHRPNSKSSINSDKKPKFTQQKIDKYVRNHSKKSKIDRYYKSPVNKKKTNNIHVKMLNNIPKKLPEEQTRKFNKIKFKINRSYYENIDNKKLFNPNTIKVAREQFNNMSSEDIYICNLISHNVVFN